MATLTDTGYDTGTGEDFLSVVLSDDELVRAEFDAIVAAEWSDLPPDRVERDDQGERPPGTPRRHPIASDEPWSSEGVVNARINGWRRQRSPPSAAPPRARPATVS